MRLLIIEDDSLIAKAISHTLSEAGYICDDTDLGEDGIELAKLYDYDAIILDLTLPDIDGFECLRRLRRAGIRTPTLILSGHDGVNDKVRAFEAGADDYVTKPHDQAELVARIQAIVRRMNGYSDSIIRAGGLAVDLYAKRVEFDEQSVRLSPKEYRVLELLILRKGKTVTKDSFMNHLYDGFDEPQPKIVDVLVCRVRTKLSTLMGDESCIETVWGRGYKLRDPENSGPRSPAGP